MRPQETTWLLIEAISNWDAQGRRRMGRPKQSWRRTVGKDLEIILRMWGEAKQIANNRTR